MTNVLTNKPCRSFDISTAQKEMKNWNLFDRGMDCYGKKTLKASHAVRLICGVMFEESEHYLAEL